MKIDMTFASDNHVGAHEKIIQAVIDANVGVEKAYGDDEYTLKAEQLFKNFFGENSKTFFVGSGTAANILSLASVMESYHAVICAKSSHINTDECGAFEKYVGGKLLSDCKNEYFVCVQDIENYVKSLRGNCHKVQPKVVSITQTNEAGQVYKLDQIKEITKIAHKYGLIVHMDGARLANAAVYLGCSLKEMTLNAGIDILSFGGIKNGTMFGEAVVFFNEKYAQNFEYIRKQGMQLNSKMRFISAQFIALLENDLWFENAKNANEMACYLCNSIKDIPGIKLISEPQGNEVFAKMKKQHVENVYKKYFFYIWQELEKYEVIVRWVTSFKTTKEDIDKFVETLRKN